MDDRRAVARRRDLAPTEPVRIVGVLEGEIVGGVRRELGSEEAAESERLQSGLARRERKGRGTRLRGGRPPVHAEAQSVLQSPAGVPSIPGGFLRAQGSVAVDVD